MPRIYFKYPVAIFYIVNIKCPRVAECPNEWGVKSPNGWPANLDGASRIKVPESERAFMVVNDHSLNAPGLFTGTAVVFPLTICAALVCRAVAQLPRYNGSGAGPALASISVLAHL